MIALIVIVIAVAGAVVLVGFGRTVRIVPQARAYVVERLGSYSRTLDAGLNTVVPFIDRVRARVDLREQVVSFAPQPVITDRTRPTRQPTITSRWPGRCARSQREAGSPRGPSYAAPGEVAPARSQAAVSGGSTSWSSGLLLISTSASAGSSAGWADRLTRTVMLSARR